jgi:hypothetical protein
MRTPGAPLVQASIPQIECVAVLRGDDQPDHLGIEQQLRRGPSP